MPADDYQKKKKGTGRPVPYKWKALNRKKGKRSEHPSNLPPPDRYSRGTVRNLIRDTEEDGG